MGSPQRMSLSLRLLVLLAILLNALLSTSVSFAQDDACTLVKDALARATSANACLQVERNHACYGGRAITLESKRSNLKFKSLNDQVKIVDIESVTTDRLGVTIMSVEASGGKEVKIVAFGSGKIDPISTQTYTYTVNIKAGGELCENTPPGMVLQTRKKEQGQITINGVTIRMKSTVFINFDTPTTTLLPASAETAILQLMTQYDEAWIQTLRDNRTNRLGAVLAGSLLNSDIRNFNANRASGCYWATEVVTPAEFVAIEPTSSTTAKVYINKNWDLDYFCSGVKRGDSDGPYVGVYVVKLQNGTWRITERKLYDIPEIERPAPPTSGKVALMTITNIEGSIEVTALGQQRLLKPKQKVQVTLSNDRPVNISEVTENSEIFGSPIIPWLATDPEGLPRINSGVTPTPTPTPTPISTPTDTLFSLTGYYTQTTQFEYGSNDKTRVCDRLVVTQGDSVLTNELLDLVRRGNAVNGENELGQLLLNIELQNLSPAQQSLIHAATIDNPVTLTVSKRESLGGDANACDSFVHVLDVLPPARLQYALTGYYIESTVGQEDGSCDRLMVTTNDKELIDKFPDVIKQTIEVNEENEVILTVHLQNLSPQEQSLLKSSTADNPVTFIVSERDFDGGGIGCSWTDVIKVTGELTETTLLPAPLYYIDEATQQIFRMEPDGVTINQITFESKGFEMSTGFEAPPIIGFDISPVDSSLVYVNENNLIQTDSKGGNRVVKVVGGSIGSMRVISDMSNPIFSPDGKIIAYEFTGIAMIASESNGQEEWESVTPTILDFFLPHELINPDSGDDPDSWLFHTPVSWSPDGQRLLISSFNRMGSSAKVIDLNTGSMVDITIDGRLNGRQPTLGSVAWSKNEELIYNGSNTLSVAAAGIEQISGLSIINTNNGNQTGLLVVPDDDQQHKIPFVQAPIVIDDNTLFFFANFDTIGNLQELMFTPIYPTDYALYRSDLNGNSIEQVGASSFGALNEVRWEKNGKGAVGVVDGEIIWISRDGHRVLLGIRGYSPKWGAT